MDDVDMDIKHLLEILSKATGIGYKPLRPVDEDIEKRRARVATVRMLKSAENITTQLVKLEKALKAKDEGRR
jgi:hypothetical protein